MAQNTEILNQYVNSDGVKYIEDQFCDENATVLGTSENDTIVHNYDREEMWLIGGDGDDTYVIEDISKTWTSIADGNISIDGDEESDDYGRTFIPFSDDQHEIDLIKGDNTINRNADDSNSGNDKLIIKNINKPSDLMFWFDVTVDDTIAPDDVLCIYKKDCLDSILANVSEANGGSIEIPCYFGDTNDLKDGVYGKNVGANYIKKIQTMDKKGNIVTIALDSYISKVRDEVKLFLQENGKTTVYEVFMGDDEKLTNKLLNIYKNTDLGYIVEYEGGLSVLKENGKTTIDLTGVTSIESNDSNVTNVITDGLFVGKPNNNDLVIKYNGDKEYIISNYLKNKGKDNITVKYNTINENNENVVKETDLKEIAIVKLDYSDKTKGVSIQGTFLKNYIDGGQGNDTIKGNNGNDYILGNEGNDVIKAGKGNDIVYGAKGNDKLYGEYDQTTFVFQQGDGQDTIYSGKSEDTIWFKNLNIDDISMSMKGNDLILRYGSENDTVSISNYLKNPDTSSVKHIKFGDEDSISLKEYFDNNPIYVDGVATKKNSLKGSKYDDVITGGNLNDTIKAGKGNDIVYGGKGNDKLYGEFDKTTFVFQQGDGQDTIYSGKGDDTIWFKNLNIDEISMSMKGNDLILRYGSENDAVSISNYLKNPETSSVKHIKFGNEDSISLKEYFDNNPIYVDGIANKKNSLKGSKYNDVIIGGDLNDTIKAGKGNDIVYGGQGNDKLYGEFDQTFFGFQKGDGNDIVYMGKGNDTLVFDESLEGNLAYEKVRNNLVIKYGNNDSVTINNYFSSKTKSVNAIAFVDFNDLSEIKSTVLFSDMFVNKNENAEGDFYIGNNNDNFVVVNNNKKTNYVISGAGNDIIYCEGKKVVAQGGEGNDKYIVSSLKNNTSIYDTNGGNDIITINEKSSNVNIIFNVLAKDYQGEHINDEEGMLIINNSTLSSLKKTKDITKVNSGIEISNFINNNGNWGEGAIERIETSDGRYTTLADLERVKEQIAGWLSDQNQGYIDTMYVMKNGDKEQINQLIGLYQTVWHTEEQALV